MHAERDLLGFCLRTRYRRVNVRAIESAKLQIGNAIFQHQSQWVANVLKVPELSIAIICSSTLRKRKWLCRPPESLERVGRVASLLSAADGASQAAADTDGMGFLCKTRSFYGTAAEGRTVIAQLFGAGSRNLGTILAP